MKLRSAQPPVPASLFLDASGGGTAVLDTPARAVAPGQACVCYDGDRVLGGGWILRAAEDVATDRVVATPQAAAALP